MHKIPTIFQRDEVERRYVTRDPNPECAWVFADEGDPTRKYDGTCVMFDGEKWWARREVKADCRTEPANFVAVATDAATGNTMGWEPIAQSSFAKFHAEAVAHQNSTGITGWPKGTYELVGPKVNGNPEHARKHELWAHAAAEVLAPIPERTYDAIREAVLDEAIHGAEGIVFHHPDGRMAKIKARDFRSEG